MSKVLAIDPGAYQTGAAIFDLQTRRLIRAARLRGHGFKNSLWNLIDTAKEVVSFAKHYAPFVAVVVEWPQVYARRQRGKKDPNDLLPLAGLDMAILALMDPYLTETCDAVTYVPHEWKGSKAANPTARLILGRLDAIELRQVEEVEAFLAALKEAEDKDKEVGHPVHNTVDAVGVGLKFLGRLDRERVIHR